MANKNFNINDKFGKWTLKKRVPGGGNGSIWDVVSDDGEIKIIKLLKKTHKTAKIRFIDEVKIMTENRQVEGVVNIIDHSDLNIDTEDLWYVMDKGILLQQKLVDETPFFIIEAIITIGKTLSILHSKGVSHRDIKPQNLFSIHNKYMIGDFGLVDYPLKEDGLTLKGKQLGPRWTIAPEMRNNPENADGLKADVYSLSKTLWILLAGEQVGFEGQYSPTGSIGLLHYQPSMYLNILEELLVNSTENNPDLRPTINDFIGSLEEWKICNENFVKKNELDWRIIQQKLFPTNLPTRVIWYDINSIISILNIIGGIKDLNHLMLPVYGGIDLEGADLSHEHSCIELDCGLKYIIIKPKRLIFESFQADPEWNYFRLELDELEPIYQKSIFNIEGVTEIGHAVYERYEYLENYNCTHGFTPSHYRNVERILSGSLVIFRKTSSYNSTPETYDGRHNKVDADGFRNYIQNLIDSGYRVIREDKTNKRKRDINDPILKLF